MVEMTRTPERVPQGVLKRADSVHSSRILIDLPTEIVLEIADYLSVMDTLNLSLSSRRLQQIIREHPSKRSIVFLHRRTILKCNYIIMENKQLLFKRNFLAWPVEINSLQACVPFLKSKKLDLPRMDDLMTCYLQPLPPKEFATITILDLGECEFDRRSLRNLLKFLKNLEDFRVVLSYRSESTPDAQTVLDILVENQEKTLIKLYILSRKVLPPLDSISHLRGLTKLREATISGHLVDCYTNQQDYSNGFFPDSIEYVCLIGGNAPRKRYDKFIGPDIENLLKSEDRSEVSRGYEGFTRFGWGCWRWEKPTRQPRKRARLGINIQRKWV